MGSQYTNLSQKNYDFLYRFLDATKANLFFARGVLLVEGDAENLLIPTLAKIIDRPLHRYGVSIVNVGSKAFNHFVEIFDRKDGELMGIKVSLITDMDVRPLEYPSDPKKPPKTEAEIENEKIANNQRISELGNAEVKGFISSTWTFEYEIALSSLFREDFYRSLLWAEKITTAKTGTPKEAKVDEVNIKVRSDFQAWQATWKDDPRKDQKIAFEIYKNTMTDNDISKAVTAQVFAQSLEEKFRDKSKVDSLKTNLQSAPTLKYLLDAIYHVTEQRSP